MDEPHIPSIIPLDNFQTSSKKDMILADSSKRTEPPLNAFKNKKHEEHQETSFEYPEDNPSFSSEIEAHKHKKYKQIKLKKKQSFHSEDVASENYSGMDSKTSSEENNISLFGRSRNLNEESLDTFIGRLEHFKSTMRKYVLKRTGSLHSVRRILLRELKKVFEHTIVIRLKKKVERRKHYLFWIVAYTHHSFFCSLGVHVLWSKEKKQIYIYKKMEETSIQLSANKNPYFFPDFIHFLDSESMIDFQENLYHQNELVPSITPKILEGRLRYRSRDRRPAYQNHHQRIAESSKNNRNHPKFYKRKKRSSKKKSVRKIPRKQPQTKPKTNVVLSSAEEWKSSSTSQSMP